jgi:hypothetical protein
MDNQAILAAYEVLLQSLGDYPDKLIINNLTQQAGRYGLLGSR